MTKMIKWYQVYCGACICEETFDTEEQAMRKAHILTCLSGHKWHVRMVLGYDR